MTLNDFMLSEIFAFLMIFCRIGAALMLMPGFGEVYVSARVRLLLALAFTLVLTTALPHFPQPPGSIFGVSNMIFAEIFTGLFLGAITRMLIAAISTAGMIIAYQSGLASALIQDVTMSGGQGSILGNMMGLCALVLLFATDMHHLMLRSLHDSYQLFPAGQFPPVSDFTQYAIHTMSSSFLMALQLASPHIVIGLIIYLAGGILARVMPNLQIFFIIQAPQLLISFFLLMLVFSSLMMWYMDYFRENISRFVGGS